MQTARPLPDGTVELMDELLGGDLSPRARERAMGVRAMAAGCTNGQVATLVGRNITTVSEWRSRYLREGASFVCAQGWGGRRHELLDEDAERAFVEGFERASERGELVTVSVIHQALVDLTGERVWPATVYRMLERHGWRKIVPRPTHPQADPERREAFKQTSRPMLQPPARETPALSD